MLPITGTRADTLTRWHKAQEHSWEFYQEHRDDPFGVFSVQRLEPAIEAGEIIASKCQGLCLDVGCGAWHSPSYMQGDIAFIGIDPYFGDRSRDFPFAQALGETLPFRSDTFNCITIMSVVGHFIEPTLALAEAYRVLKSRGLCFVWFISRVDSDGHHPHHFTSEEMIGLMEAVGFVQIDREWFAEKVPEWPATCMISGRV